MEENNKVVGVEYKVNGLDLKLTNKVVMQVLAPSANLTEQEAFFYMNMCKALELNPFTKEIYALKIDGALSYIISKEAYLRRAFSHPRYKGNEAGIVIRNKKGEISRTNGIYSENDGDKIIGGWATVYVTGQEKPTTIEVNFEEYCKRDRNGGLQNQWKKKPATMIRKVALVQALREAFPDKLNAMYIEEEQENYISDGDYDKKFDEELDKAKFESIYGVDYSVSDYEDDEYGDDVDLRDLSEKSIEEIEKEELEDIFQEELEELDIEEL